MNDENTIYDDERTQFQGQDGEATQYDDTSLNNNEEKNETSESRSNKDPMWKKAAAGLGTGILLGAAATVFSSSAPIDHQEGDETTHPSWTDGEVPVAASVSDDMSFSEAFNAARTEVGSGGVFEWHGNIYSTYTEDEWNNMTVEERTEYGSHFSWHSDSHNDTASSRSSHSSVSNQTHASTDEVEVVAENNGEESRPNEINNVEEVEITGITPGTNGEDIIAESQEPEIEILGVVHDEESGANIGGLVVDGQEVVLIDVDGDETFDVMGSDLNSDQQITQEELVDISGQNLTVNDLGGMSMTGDSMYASNNGVDYINDAGIYEG